MAIASATAIHFLYNSNANAFGWPTGFYLPFPHTPTLEAAGSSGDCGLVQVLPSMLPVLLNMLSALVRLEVDVDVDVSELAYLEKL